MNLHRQLSESVGAEHVALDANQRVDFVLRGLFPDLVVSPGTLGELAEVMAAAYAAGATIIPWGGGTRQALGGEIEPHGPTLVVRTARLNHVLEYEPGDLTISVEAGATMTEVSTLLAPHNQMLPVDVALPARSTIGGTLATAADGPRRLGYGTTRDLLIGIKVVEATGRMSRAGGMVVKNVSGFDMMKLYVGSMGTLAVIASANFKLIPRPRAAATLLVVMPSIDVAFNLVDAIHTSQLVPTAVELMMGTASYRARLLALSDLLDISGPLVLLAICTEGLPAAVARHLRELETMAKAKEALTTLRIADEAHTHLWSHIADFAQIATIERNEVVLRLHTLPSDQVRAIADAVALARGHATALLVDARALSGVTYLRLRLSSLDLLTSYQRALSSRWPNLVVLIGPSLPKDVPIWGREPEGFALMQRIKAEFDPQNRLNPGRYIV